jgi:mono/diheme cytochrome c family protein
MIRKAIAVLLAASLPLAASAQMMGNDRRWGAIGPGISANLARHQQVLMFGVPAPYRTLRDPSPYAAGKVSRGAMLFQQNCAACHGVAGQGNGPGSQMLSSPPANLAWLARTPMNRADGYMYWSIAEGGEPFGSDMPVFKAKLSRTDIWALIAYIREGLPGTS